jgi:hypothetical protein
MLTTSPRIPHTARPTASTTYATSAAHRHEHPAQRVDEGRARLASRAAGAALGGSALGVVRVGGDVGWVGYVALVDVGGYGCGALDAAVGEGGGRAEGAEAATSDAVYR